ncbi:MAG: PilZ domain-containing protein [Candidatus Omnitrophica bacterium]|nr:PilZ domain-containing protein [Candidatus Omnitrophota bacterium]
MADERRAHPRLRVYYPVRLYPWRSTRMVETLTKDLGIGGCRSLSATVLPVDSEVRVELMLPQGREPIVAKGRTVWFRAIPESEQFDVGIIFSDLSNGDKRRLSACLQDSPASPATV